MNALEDELWSAQVTALASSVRGRAALLVKRGRRLADSTATLRSIVPLAIAIREAGVAARGSTAYVAHPLTPEALELAASAKVRRIVLVSGEMASADLQARAARAGIEISGAREAPRRVGLTGS